MKLTELLGPPLEALSEAEAERVVAAEQLIWQLYKAQKKIKKGSGK